MKISRLLGSLIIGLVSVSAALATAQAPDRIFYKGVEKMLFSNPLEEYYSADKEKRPRFMIEPMVVSSGNWRGYVATWVISDGKLYLTKVDSWLCPDPSVKESCQQVELGQLFPGKISDGRILADWYTGKLRVPDGEQLQYVHMGYGSTYERDMIFDVKKGEVGEPEIIDNTKRELPSPMDAMRTELEKLKDSPLGDQPAFGAVASTKNTERPQPKREPRSGLVIVPGQGVFSVGTKRKDLEAVVGDGEEGSKYEDVYFVEYPKAGVQVSYENGKDAVHVIFLYNNQARYESFVVPKVKTDKGIDWNATPKDILKAYGKPLKDFSDDGPARSWRRLEYPGIDFLFQGGKLGRIGILGPGGN
jgi:hypothetical protein